jgi:hypothetical protein
MIRDYFHNFGLPGITNSTAKTVSVNVYDAGANVILFASGKPAKIVWKTVITADASPTILIEFVGSDNVDGDPNDNEANLNVLLGSSGIVRTNMTGAVLASGDTVYGEFPIGMQYIARRYYALLTTLGGTNPDIVAATSSAHLVLNAQTNMRGARAAIPA